MMKSTLSILVLASVITACGAAPTSATSMSGAAKFTYNCDHPSNDYIVSEQSIQVTFKGDSVKVDAGEYNGVGTIDPDYKPTANWAGYVRFNGFEDLWSDDGFIQMLAPKDMLTGAPKGRVAFRWTGEAFNQQSFRCVLN